MIDKRCDALTMETMSNGRIDETTKSVTDILP